MTCAARSLVTNLRQATEPAPVRPRPDDDRGTAGGTALWLGELLACPGRFGRRLVRRRQRARVSQFREAFPAGRWWCRPITSLRSSQSLHGVYRVCGVSLFANSSELNAGFIGPRRRRAGKPRAFLIRRGRRSNVPYSVPPDERECAPPCGSAAIWSAGRRPREDCTAIGLSRADSLRLMF